MEPDTSHGIGQPTPHAEAQGDELIWPRTSRAARQEYWAETKDSQVNHTLIPFIPSNGSRAQRGFSAPAPRRSGRLSGAQPANTVRAMASDKALPVLPLRTSSVLGSHNSKIGSPQYVYEHPRELWVHHRKTSQGETSLGGWHRPQPQPGYGAQYRQYQRHRQSSLPGHNALGITVPNHGYGHGPQLRRTSRTLPNNTLPPSPDS